MTDVDNNTTSCYNYDSLDRLVSSWQKIGTSVNSYTYYRYDDMGRAYKSDFYLDGTSVGTLSHIYTYTYDDDDGSITNINVKNGSNSENISFTYDALKRLSGKTVNTPNASLSYSYAYKTLSGNRSSNLVSNYTAYINSAAVRTYGYTYDKLSNITAITSGGTTESVYTYDAQGQLLSETIASKNLKLEYTYDDYGNIKTVTKKSISPDATIETYEYTYDTNWKDQLKTYTIKDSSGETITSGTFTYDNIGNPTKYFNGSSYEFTWQNGRELATSKKNGITTTYKYGADGLRISKSGYEFFYSDGKLVRQVWADGEVLDFLYDESGTPYAMQYYSTMYYYVKNLQGDVVAIADANGNIVVEYVYDAWGNILSITGSLASTIGNINPIRYRSYYYDSETGFYYLQSRYYDPAIRRFINADGYVNANGDILGFNMYAYCGNNPVMGYDPTGEWNWGGVIIGLGIITATVVTVATFGIGSMAGAVIATAAISTGSMVTYAAATDATLVVDLSFSKSDGSNYAKAGYSVVIDFDSNSSSAYLYPHLGGGKGYSDGLSYSVGLVENFEDPKDYAGAFFDASVTGFMGVDHCYNPWVNYEQSTKATSLTFSNGFSASAGYDWYFEPIKVWGK